MEDPYVHLKFRYPPDERIRKEVWHYEPMRMSSVNDVINALAAKGCGRFYVRRLDSREPWVRMHPWKRLP